MTVKLGIYAMFLLKMVVEGVYFKNPTGATLGPLGKFLIDVISHAHFFTYTVSHKKRATLFLIITPAFLGRLL